MFVALALVASACGSADSVVASVNGTEIPRSQVDKLAPEGDGDIVASEFPRFLSVVIQWEAISQAAEKEYGITPTDEEITARLTEFVAGQAQGTTLEAYLASVNASEEGVREFAKQLIIQDRVQVELADSVDTITDDAVNNELVVAAVDWTVVCASHILVATEEEALAVVERLEAGDEFAVLAQELSIDASSGAVGGTLNCGSPSNFVLPFAVATMDAEIDVPTDPVESEFGFHIIVVSQREEATPEIVRESLETEALTAAVDAWFADAIESATVTVADEIGVWVTEPSPQVVSLN